jgi:Cytochrome C'
MIARALKAWQYFNASRPNAYLRAMEYYHDRYARRDGMRLSSVLMTGLFLISGACAREAHQEELQTIATIKDIMDSMVDPSGDFIFESVVQIADENGVREKAPSTDEEWAAVRRHALVLLEAPNLLTMEGRKVAQPGEKAENPQVELHPEDIQKLIDNDRPSFIRRARKLQDAAAEVLKAVEAKDKSALFHAIESIDKACESCHLHYWYPNDTRAQEAAKENGIVD